MLARFRSYCVYVFSALFAIVLVFLLAGVSFIGSLQYCPGLWRSLFSWWVEHRLGHPVSFSLVYEPELFTLHPAIHIKKLHFGDGSEALHLAALDLSFRWKDVLWGYPHADAITVLGLHLPITHVHGNRYRVAGMPIETGGGGSSLFTIALMQTGFSVSNADIIYRDPAVSGTNGHPAEMTIHVDNLSWQRAHEPFSMSVHGAVPQAYGGAFDLGMSMDHVPTSDPWAAHLFFRGQFPRFAVLPWLHLLGWDLPMAEQGWHWQEGALSVQWDSEWSHRSLMMLKASLSANRLRFRYRQQDFAFDTLELHPHLSSPVEESDGLPKQWDVDFDPFIYGYAGGVQRLESCHVTVYRPVNGAHWPKVVLTMPSLSLADWSPLLRDVVHAVHPLSSSFMPLSFSGQLQNIRLAIQGDDSGKWLFFAQMHGHDVGMYMGNRAVEHLISDVRFQRDTLSLFVDSPDFVLRIPEVFSAPMSGALAASCRMTMSADLQCQHFRLKTADGIFSGHVAVHPDARSTSPDIDLHVSVPVFPATHLSRYFPRYLTAVHHYFEQAFLSGHFTRLDWSWSGHVDDFPYQDKPGHFLIESDFDGIRLHYADAWPTISDLRGHVRYDGQKVLLSTLSAQSLGLHFDSGHLYFPDLHHSHLQLLVSASGDAQHYFAFMQQSPLQTYVRDWSHLSLSGPVKTQLRLNLFWDKPEDTVFGLRLHFVDTRLFWEKHLLCQLSGAIYVAQGFLRDPSSLMGYCDGSPWSLVTKKSAQGEVITVLDGILHPDFISAVLGYPALSGLLVGTAPLHAIWRHGDHQHFAVAVDARLSDLSFQGVMAHLWRQQPQQLHLHYEQQGPVVQMNFAVDDALNFSWRTGAKKQGQGDQALHWDFFCGLGTLRPVALYDLFAGVLGDAKTQKATTAGLDFSHQLAWLQSTDWRSQCTVDHVILHGADQGPLSLISAHRSGDHWLSFTTRGWAAGRYVFDAESRAMAVDMAYLQWHLAPISAPLLKPEDIVSLLAPKDVHGNVCFLETRLTHITQLFPCAPSPNHQAANDALLSGHFWEDSPILPSVLMKNRPEEATDDLSRFVQRLNDHLPRLAVIFRPFSLLTVDIHSIIVERKNWGTFSLRGALRAGHFVMTKLLVNSPLFTLFFLEDPFEYSDTSLHYLFSMTVDNLEDLIYPAGSHDPVIKEGQLLLKGQFNWPVGTVLPSLHALSAYMDVSISQGLFPQVRPGIAKLLGLLNVGYFARYLAGQDRHALSAGAFFFDRIQTKLSLDHDQLAVQDFVLKSPIVSLQGSGTFDLFPVRFDGRILAIPDTASSSLLVGALLGLSPLSLVLLNANSFVLSRFSSLIGIRYLVSYDKGEWSVTRAL